MTDPQTRTRWAPGRPVHLGAQLAVLQRGRADPTQRWAGDVWWRTARTPMGPATLALRSDSGAITATAWGPGAEWAVQSVPALLGGNDDPTGLRPLHQAVEGAWRRWPHLRLGGTGLVFEVLVPAILEQRVTGSEARRSWRELLRRFGEPAPGPAPAGMRVVPPPEVWRRLPSWEWHRAGVDPGRARTVIAAAEVAHRLEESLRLDRDQRLARLQAVPGIGVWTAAEVAQRAWGDADAVSVGDFHLPALVGWALAGRPVDDAGMLELLAGYGDQRQRAVRLVELSGVRKPAFGPRMPVADIRGL